MPRRLRAESEEAFSLFPFLAVLLCTMGTLALVFVLIAQKTSADPIEDAVEERAIAFDASAGLKDAVPYGSIIGADELADAINNGLGGKKRHNVDSLAEDAGEHELEAPLPENAYEEALVKTGAASLEEVLDEKETVEWFLQELTTIDSKSAETFEEERQRLANAEAGIAKIREEADVAQKRYDALMQENTDDQGAETLKARVAELDQEIEKLGEETADLREQNANAKKSYAIVPYQGKKGTFRRPIYVECNDSGVYIQPEGIRFDDSDFLLAQYPGNPFDTALRAASQRFLVTGGQRTASGEAIEPYPLIIVRPSGARYFYAAIAALASWGGLYGYEFVEEDLALAYPEPDPVLKTLAQGQADDARQRMQVQLANALSIRNAQIVAESRARRNASSSTAAAAAVPDTELQARLGSNVRLGAANPLAGDADLRRVAERTNAPDDAAARGAAQTPRNAGEGAPFAAEGRDRVAVGTANASLTPPPQMALGGAPRGAAPRAETRLGGVGTYASGAGVFTSAADNVANAALANADRNGDGALARDVPSTDLYAPYTTSDSASASQSALNGGADAEFATQQGVSPAGEFALGAPSQTTRQDASQYFPNSSAQAMISPPCGDTTQGVELASDVAEGPLANLTDASIGDNQEETNGIPNIFDKTVDLSDPPEKKEIREDEKLPKEAYLVSRELSRTATRGNERAISVRCAPQGYVFPQQPGLRSRYTVAYETKGKTRLDRDAEIADVITLCVKSWGVAGRNMYWAPYVKVEVLPGGENGLRELHEFCDAQGLTLVLKDPESDAKATPNP
jgi:hypothetical protein